MTVMKLREAMIEAAAENFAEYELLGVPINTRRHVASEAITPALNVMHAHELILRDHVREALEGLRSASLEEASAVAVSAILDALRA